MSLGGWTDSGSDKYSRLVSDQKARGDFSKKAVEKLKQHKFDGLSLEWHYPVCWQADCSKGNPSEKQGFTALSKVKIRCKYYWYLYMFEQYHCLKNVCFLMFWILCF